MYSLLYVYKTIKMISVAENETGYNLIQSLCQVPVGYKRKDIQGFEAGVKGKRQVK